MKKILDNGHIMHYNNHCSAGVAHLVERDLAKVEVASSSLVARSKITPSDRAVFFFLHLSAGQRLEQGTSEARETCRGHVLVPACVWRPGWAASEPRRPLQNNTIRQGGVFFFAFIGRAEARTGHERSERNMPGACFGARVRVAARLGRQRASSPAPKNYTIPIGWCFFAFIGRAEAQTGHERSERNMPGACFGARVRVAARLGRQRASSPAPKRNTIPTGWCFFAFAGPLAMCSPSCRQHKSVVFLRRFCFARKME